MYMLPRHRIPLSHMMHSGSQHLAENVTIHNDGNDTSIQGLKADIMDSANSYFGVTGNTTLNRVGDRAEGKYDCWIVVAGAVEGTAPTFSWNKTPN